MSLIVPTSGRIVLGWHCNDPAGAEKGLTAGALLPAARILLGMAAATAQLALGLRDRMKKSSRELHSISDVSAPGCRKLRRPLPCTAPPAPHCRTPPQDLHCV